MKLFSQTILVFFCLMLSSASSGQDDYQWLRFRGTGGLGLDPEREVPVKWDSTDYRWKIDLPGVGHSSPVVWGNKIFVSSADDEKDTGYLLAVNDQDGKILWKKDFKLTDIKLHPENNPAWSTPVLDESHIYHIWYSIEKTHLIALTHEGNMVWEAEFEGIEARHGGGSSPMLTDKYVVFLREQEKGHSSLKSSWVAVDKQTGETAWELERNAPENNTFGIPIELRGKDQKSQLIFGSQIHGLTSLDPESGMVLWELSDLLPARVVASPFYVDGKLVVCRKGQTLVIEIDADSREAPDSAKYTLPVNLSPYVPTPIVVGEYLYLFMDNGTVACVILETGELIWKERPAGPIFGSPVCVGGNLYCISKEGQVLVIKADPSYELLGINELGEGSFSTPVMSPEGMVFRTFSKLMLLGKHSTFFGCVESLNQ